MNQVQMYYVSGTVDRIGTITEAKTHFRKVCSLFCYSQIRPKDTNCAPIKNM